MKQETTLQKIGKKIDRELRDIQARRMMDVDKNYSKMISKARLLDAAVKLPEWATLKPKLIKLPREEELR